jgi:hypothetical protein
MVRRGWKRRSEEERRRQMCSPCSKGKDRRRADAVLLVTRQVLRPYLP